MKAKFKGGGFKGLVLEHGEKAVFALGVVCFLLFAYSLLGRETLPLDKQPNKLVDAANEAKNWMESQLWDPVREGISVVNYLARANRVNVTASDYEFKVPLDLPLRIPKIKRADPELYAVADLRTAAGMGAFVLKSERSAPPPPAAEPAAKKPVRGARDKKPRANDALGDDPKPVAAGGRRPIDIELPYDVGVGGVQNEAKLSRQQWAVVTALVPYRNQVAEYERVFKDAISLVDNGGVAADKLRDIPAYAGPQVERREIGDDGAPGPWEPLSFRFYGKLRGQWAMLAPDIVGQDYLDPAYTMPLGPNKTFEWDESVGHEPEIPLAAKEEIEQNEKLAKQAAPAEPQTAGNDFGFGVPADPAKAPPQPPPQAAKREEKKVVEFRLVRIFDFEVQEGKTYQYRVRLVMNNPNYALADKFLKNVDSKKDKFRETPWSDPSPPVKILPPEEIMFAGVQPAHGTKDTSIRVKLMSLDPEMGVPAMVEEDLPRGSTLNLQKKVEVADLIKKEFVEKEVNFATDALLVDIRGGRSFSARDKSLTEPGEGLFVTRNGKLVAHNEIDDLDLWEHYPLPDEKKEGDSKKVKEKKKDPNSALDDKAPLKKRKRRSRG